MDGDVKTTTDHGEIKRWAEFQGGAPGIKKSGAEDRLALAFPGVSNGPIKKITWDDFFRRFEARRLALTYQRRDSRGATSHRFQFVERS